MMHASEKKEWIPGYDLIRAVSAMMIALFHFVDLAYRNAGWERLSFVHIGEIKQLGILGVQMFFMISGALLYRNNKTINHWSEAKTFYKKRISRIFPIYYFSFLIFYIGRVMKSHTFFYAGNPLTLLFTVFGMDGYFSDIYPNYFSVGEWFTGAIIILYAIYPLLLVPYRKNKYITVLLIAVLHILNAKYSFIPYNLLQGLLPFSIGMMLSDKLDQSSFHGMRAFLGAILFLGTSAVIAYSIAIPSIPALFLPAVQAFSLIIVLYEISKPLAECRIWKCISFLSEISYPVYLIQHRAAYYFYSSFMNDALTLNAQAIVLFADLTAVILAGYFLNLIDKRILHRKKRSETV